MGIEISRNFFLRRLHSLSGVVPLGLFLLEHFYTNFAAVESPRAYDNAVAQLHYLLPGPLLPIAEITFIGLPIIFHALLGIYIAATMKNNTFTYTYGRNWLYFLQRLSGVFLVVFIAIHVASMRFGFWGIIGRHLAVSDHIGDPINGPYSIVHADLSNLPILFFYLIGVIASAYHFSYGLWSFAIHWGITISERSQRASQWIFTAFGILVMIFGVVSALAFI